MVGGKTVCGQCCRTLDASKSGLEERNWKTFNEICREMPDLNKQNKHTLQNVMQGWCSCLVQTLFTIVISVCFLVSMGSIDNTYDLSNTFARLNEEYEVDVRVPADFMAWVLRMEHSLMRTQFDYNDTSLCGQLFETHCIMGSKDDQMMQTIQDECWVFNNDTGFVDEYNRLMYASYMTQTRRAAIPCPESTTNADPFIASRECLSETEEAKVFEITEGPCVGHGSQYVANDVDNCFKFSGFKYSSDFGMFVNNLPEATEAWPGYNDCRVREFTRLHWADSRSKELCYKFNLINFQVHKLLRYSNCFKFDMTGNVDRTKVITVLNLVTPEVYSVAYPLCVLGVIITVLRLALTTLFGWKELIYGCNGRSRNRNFLCGVLRDLTFTEHVFMWISSLLFISYFALQIHVLTEILNVSYVDKDQGMTKVDAYAVFVQVFFYKVFDNISMLEWKSQVAACIAMVAFLVNTVIFVYELNFHPKLGIVGSIIGAVTYDLIAFGIVLFTLMTLSTLIAYTVFGRFWKELAEFPLALESVSSAFLGDVERLLENSDAVPPDFVVGLFHAFIWFIRLLGSVLLLNLLITIFARSYDKVRRLNAANHVELFHSLQLTIVYWGFGCCVTRDRIKSMIQRSFDKGNNNNDAIRHHHESLTRAHPLFGGEGDVAGDVENNPDFMFKKMERKSLEHPMLVFLKTSSIPMQQQRFIFEKFMMAGITTVELLLDLNLAEPDLVALGITDAFELNELIRIVEVAKSQS